MIRRTQAVFCLMLWVACDPVDTFDAGARDSGPVSTDAGVVDAGAAEMATDAGLAFDGGLTLDGGPNGGAPDAGGFDAGRVDAGRLVDAGSGLRDAGSTDAGCPGTLCDGFDRYDAGPLRSNTTLGPWRVTGLASGGYATIDPTRAFTGSHSLKIHIDAAASSGGQLSTQSGTLFASPRAQLYGRFMMYLEPNSGTSTHWTMFGATGVIPSGSPTAGNRAAYMYSAFNDATNNRFGAVYYNNQTRQDCWHHSMSRIPTGRWACVSFAVDGMANTYRMGLDGQPVPSMSIDGVGDGCLNAPGNAPWTGPRFDEFYLGALSFHAMSRSLDLWVDDVVLDTRPVSCP